MSQFKNTVKPMITTTVDRGGAAIAAIRLHLALQQIGVDSQYVVAQKTTDHDTVIDLTQSMHHLEERWLNRIYKKNTILNKQTKSTGGIFWSTNQRWNTVPFRLRTMQQNLIHLHWIGNGYIPIDLLHFVGKPIIWTMHDNWAYTGGCHVHLDCERYLQGCGMCPQLGSDNPNDLSRKLYLAKQHAWQQLDLTIITPSHWLGKQFRKSPIFANHRIEVIPNAIDLNQFKHISTREARQQLQLQPDAKFLLFSAFSLDDHNKGGDLLLDALYHLADQTSDVQILLIGTEHSEIPFPENVSVHRLGFISDEATMNLIYAAADACVVPSRQENLSNTIMESLASGTPAIAFDVGGNADLVQHRQTGYLASPYDSQDLAHGITWAINHKSAVSNLARDYVLKHYEASKIAQRHLDLYQETLNQAQ